MEHQKVASGSLRLPGTIDDYKRLPVLHGLLILHKNFDHPPRYRRFNFVEYVQGFDGTNKLACLDVIANSHQRSTPGLEPGMENTYERSDNRMPCLFLLQRGRGRFVMRRGYNKLRIHLWRSLFRRLCFAQYQVDTLVNPLYLDFGHVTAVEQTHKALQLADTDDTG